MKCSQCDAVLFLGRCPEHGEDNPQTSPAKSTEQVTKPTEPGQEVRQDAARIAELEAERDTLKVQRAEYRQRAEQAEAQVAALRSLLTEAHQALSKDLINDHRTEPWRESLRGLRDRLGRAAKEAPHAT